MFWRVASGSVSSPVEALLEGEDFTLAQLLAEDKLVQVHHSSNCASDET